MSHKAKLILGTANFGPQAYGQLKEPLSLTQIDILMDRARKYGIKILEGSELYQCDDVLSKQQFELIYKVKHPYSLATILSRLGRSRLLGLMYHHGFDTQSVDINRRGEVDYTGASIYKANQLTGYEQMVEVPLNLEQRQFEMEQYPCKIVRSVFGRGELLKKYSVKECLEYVCKNPTVHGVIIGVDNIKQLDEIMMAWKELDEVKK